MKAAPIELWCLHGALGEATDWRQLKEQAGPAGVSLRQLDLWRFLACGPVSPGRFGELLNALAPPVSGTRRILLGYSMGGRLALHALLANGAAAWDAAVIVSAHPGLESADERAARREADAEWAALAHSGDWEELLEKWNAQPVFAPDGRVRGPVPDRRRLVGRRREIARSFVDWSLGAQEPLTARLAGIGVPVLWVVGEHDAKFRRLGEQAVDLLPGGELHVGPGAGHRVPWETPAGFAESVLEFLEQPAP